MITCEKCGGMRLRDNPRAPGCPCQRSGPESKESRAAYHRDVDLVKAVQAEAVAAIVTVSIATADPIMLAARAVEKLSPDEVVMRFEQKRFDARKSQAAVEPPSGEPTPADLASACAFLNEHAPTLSQVFMKTAVAAGWTPAFAPPPSTPEQLLVAVAEAAYRDGYDRAEVTFNEDGEAWEWPSDALSELRIDTAPAIVARVLASERPPQSPPDEVLEIGERLTTLADTLEKALMRMEPCDCALSSGCPRTLARQRLSVAVNRVLAVEDQYSQYMEGQSP